MIRKDVTGGSKPKYVRDRIVGRTGTGGRAKLAMLIAVPRSRNAEGPRGAGYDGDVVNDTRRLLSSPSAFKE
jgi:hypothetical protein